MESVNQLLTVAVSNLSKFDLMQKLMMKYLEDKGVPSSQKKTLAKFTAYCNAVAVGQTQIAFNFPGDINGAVSGGTSGATYNDSEHFFILGLRHLQGANATLNATAWATGITDALSLNGRLTLENNGTQELKDIPLTQFVASTGNADLDSGTLILEKPVLWVGQTPLVVRTTFPTVLSTATLNHRIELIGFKMI